MDLDTHTGIDFNAKQPVVASGISTTTLDTHQETQGFGKPLTPDITKLNGQTNITLLAKEANLDPAYKYSSDIYKQAKGMDFGISQPFIKYGSQGYLKSKGFYAFPGKTESAQGIATQYKYLDTPGFEWKDWQELGIMTKGAEYELDRGTSNPYPYGIPQGVTLTTRTVDGQEHYYEKAFKPDYLGVNENYLRDILPKLVQQAGDYLKGTKEGKYSPNESLMARQIELIQRASTVYKQYNNFYENNAPDPEDFQFESSYQRAKKVYDVETNKYFTDYLQKGKAENPVFPDFGDYNPSGKGRGYRAPADWYNVATDIVYFVRDLVLGQSGGVQMAELLKQNLPYNTRIQTLKGPTTDTGIKLQTIVNNVSTIKSGWNWLTDKLKGGK